MMFAAHDLTQYVTAIETCHTDGVFAQGRNVWEWMLGRWTFVREIPGYASARGEAWIRAEGEDRARYEESAQVALAWGGTLRGTQCYLYLRLGMDGLEILFCESGKVFERLTFRERDGGGLEARARCVCGADEYVSEYRLEGEDRLEVWHAVRGPRKDYRVQTVYRRVRGGTSPGTKAPVFIREPFFATSFAANSEVTRACRSEAPNPPSPTIPQFLHFSRGTTELARR